MSDSEIIVYTREHGLPYSKGLMAQSFMATGLSPEKAYNVAAAVGRSLRRRGPVVLTLSDLETIACETLGADEGRDLVARFRQWQELAQLERPLVILIGGATGVGKSTLATQMAHRLGITRVASTDTVRQVMRAFFAADLMPEVHCSSFDARGAVRIPLPKSADLYRAGFIEQVKSVAVGIDAIVRRAISEELSTIVEGVHVVPGFLDKTHWGEAVVVELVLCIDDPERHRSHFYVREWETGGVRPLQRYIRHFNHIRKVQKYVLAQAEKQGTTVIENESLDQTVKAVMDNVLDAVGASRRQIAAEAGR